MLCIMYVCLCMYVCMCVCKELGEKCRKNLAKECLGAADLNAMIFRCSRTTKGWFK